MLQFKTNTTIFDKKVKIAEFTLKEYKVILKSLLSIDHTPEVFIDTVQELFSYKINISKDYIQQCNFIEFFILLLRLKCVSSSHVVGVQVEINNKKTNINLNLIDVIDYINTLDIPQMLLNDRVEDVVVQYRIPTIKEVLTSEEQNLFCSFMQCITIKNTHNINFAELSIKDKKNAFNALPLKVAIYIKKRAEHIINYFNKIDLLSCIPELLGEINLFFNLEKKNLTTLIKLVFGEDLKTVYENQFLLSKYGNISAEYLETCTLGEYYIFVGLLNKDFKRNENNANSTENVDGLQRNI